MANIPQMLEDRRGVMAIEDFAPTIPMRISTYYRYRSGDRAIGVSNIRKVAAWAKRNDDRSLLKALIAYALGFDVNLAEESIS